MTVLEIVKTKLQPAAPRDEELLLVIEEIEQTIKNFCNIETVPEALKFVEANMAVDLQNYYLAISNTSGTGDVQDIDVSEINSLRIGDTTIGLGNGSDTNVIAKAKKSHVPNLDQIVMNYREQLCKFRRMVW